MTVAAAGAAPVPRRLRAARALVLTAVFVCAACGLVYELALVALGSYLVGDTVTNASLVLAVMVFAMGIGSLAAKPLQRHAATAFAVVETALAVVGGLSVIALYAAFAWLNLYAPVLVVVSFAVGLLIGAEIPLLMTLLQRIRPQDAGSAVADLFAADYVGALAGGLAFPFLLLPRFGLITGTLLVGAVNAVAGTIVVLGLYRRDLPRRPRIGVTVAAVAALAVLLGTVSVVSPFQVAARQALYTAPVVFAEQTRYQDIVLTQALAVRGDPEVRLYLNGDLQFASRDERRYHEALVHPALSGPRRHVLVLGGGDGLAVREILGYPDVERVTLVELDAVMVELARTDPRLLRLNRGSLADPRVNVVVGDAFAWLRDHDGPVAYDAVIVDMPDPDAVATAKLYSTEFYGLARRVLAPGGRLVVQGGSLSSARAAFWCITTTVAEAGLATVPYRVGVPSFGGDWGFVLAGAGVAPRLALAAGRPRLTTLDDASLAAATVFPPDQARLPVGASTLDDPKVLRYRIGGLLDG